ncbi:MAG: M14 family metallopeptidase [Chloroflexota bacterium]|nr:M14 family metallopeptidase [Chloroflexota bacterium]
MNRMTLGTVSVASGEVAIGELPVATGMDAREVAIPLAVVRGRRSGPTLLVEGGLHGIEIATIDICRRLLRERLDPDRLSGTVLLAPQLNPWAFLASSRFTPQDAQDMNRVFPGTAGSTLSFQVARVVTRELLDPADFVIDCHSCNPPSLHFTIIGEEGSPAVREQSLAMARAFGYPVVNANTNYVGTLSGHCLAQGKPTITPEFVFSRRLDPISVRTGVTGILNVLRHLGMLAGDPEPVVVPGAFEELLTYRSISATKGGLCYFTKECGDRVAEGEPLAVLRDFWGEDPECIRAPQDGIVIAYPIQANQAVATGDKVAYLAS